MGVLALFIGVPFVRASWHQAFLDNYERSVAIVLTSLCGLWVATAILSWVRLARNKPAVSIHWLLGISLAALIVMGCTCVSRPTY